MKPWIQSKRLWGRGNMSDLNLDFFKKRPSEELLEHAKKVVHDINPDLVKELDDVFDEEDED